MKKEMKKSENGSNPHNIKYYLYPFKDLAKIAKYKILLIRPSIIGLLFFLVWELLHNLFVFKIEDDRSLQITLLAFEVFGAAIVTLHGFLASLFLIRLFDRDGNIAEALENKDEKLFRASTRVIDAGPFHFLLFFYSMLFFVGFLTFPFPNDKIAFFFIFLTMLFVFLIWEVATELTDPYKGINQLDKNKVKKIFREDFYEKNNSSLEENK